MRESTPEFYAGIGPCIDHGLTKNIHELGYGRARRDGRSQVMLHRVVYVDSKGLSLSDIDGLVIRHRCDNGRCINPDHLIIGTHADNKRDSLERGRVPCGEDHSNSKLTEADVEYCRKHYVARSRVFGGAALARKFGVSQRAIWMVLTGKTWTHISGENDEK
jgi:hypothetical protein